MGWLKHAFSVDKGLPEPSPLQAKVVDDLCTWIVRKGYTTPALMAIEMSRPLNYVGAHTIHFFMPIVRILFDAEGLDAFAKFLEHRGSLEYIVQRIETIEGERTGDRRQNRGERNVE